MKENRVEILWKKIRIFSEDMKRENLSSHASSAAFFIFLSMVPALILICSIIPYTPITKGNLLEFILEITPEKMDGLITAIVDDVYRRSAGVLSIAVLVTLWSAGKGVLAVIRGLNAVNEVVEKRNYFVLRFIASFYTLVMLLIVLASMILLIFGNTLVNMVLLYLPGLESVFDYFMNFRFLTVWIVLTIIFAAFYAYLPDKKLKFRRQLAGASFSAVGWNIFTWGFSIYIDLGNSFNVYGNLSLIIIFMVWLYICIYIMFIGAYLNKWMSV